MNDSAEAVRAPSKWAVLDLETRGNLALAREVLGASAAALPDADVRKRLTERRRKEGPGDFLKLPFHEPVASAVLHAERQGASPGGPILTTDWRCWVAGNAPLDRFVEGFFEDLSGRVVVGFNSQGFDLPVMELWASRCRVSVPAHFDRFDRAENPRDKASALHVDLQKELTNGAWGSGSFDELCKFHGLPGKPGVDGEDVERLVAEGRLAEVHAYNVTDVLQTHLLFLHVEVRAGRLTRAAARESALSALAATRQKVLARLEDGSAARGMLARCVEGCARAPIACP